MLEATSLVLTYGVTPALRQVSFSIGAGQRVALMGPSGCGKSSLLHCLCGIVLPDEGQVTFGDRDLTQLSDRERSRLRLEHFGVVFQFGDMVPELSLLENVALPLELLGESRQVSQTKARALLDEVGVGDVAGSRAGEVSGGQAQRAAVARALVHEPRVVLADEPTGSLDSTTSETVLDTMVALTRRIDAALLLVTHDNVVASHLDELVTMHDGRVVSPAAVDW